jgi:hypothetical protein
MRSLMLALALLLAGAPAAYAGYFTGVPVDGPSSDIDSLGGVSLARDGGGDVIYVKGDHVFVSLLASGSPRQPQQIDTGQPAASSQARVAASDDGRVAAVWVNGGSLYAAVRPSGADAWGAPQQVYAGDTQPASNPSLSISQHGAAYVAFQAGGDVRAAHMSAGAASFTLLDAPLDIDPARVGTQPDIAASSDGTAVATFTETGGDGLEHVYVRRVIRTQLSQVPREVGVTDLDGFAGGSADEAQVDVEDDSSYAWVVFRQQLGGVPRILARRLVGSNLQNPVIVDGNASNGEKPAFDMTGKGRGLLGIGIAGTAQVYGTPLNAGDVWGGATQLAGVSSAPADAVAEIAENARGTVAWQSTQNGAPPSIVARYWNARFWEGPATLTDPQYGPADVDRGLSASGDSDGNGAIAFVQGDGDQRRILVAVYDKEPREVAGSNRSAWKTDQRPSFSWSRIEDSWGAVTYRVDIDGVPMTTLTGTRWTPSSDLPDGAHVWNVVAVDSRGQTTIGPDRTVRVDTHKPTASLTGRSRVKKGRPVGAILNATDGDAITGSGVASAAVTWGDGTRGVLAVPHIGLIDDMTLGHRYARPGRKTIRIVLKDKAGNARVVKKVVRVTK